MEHTVAIGSLVGDIAVLLILFLLRVLFIFLNIVLILAILLLLLLLSLLLVLLLFRLFLHLNLVPLRNLPLFFIHIIAGRHDVLLLLFLLFDHGHVIVRFGCITPPLALFLVVLFLVLLFFLSISATQHPTAILPVIRARCLHHLPLALLLFLLFLLLRLLHLGLQAALLPRHDRLLRGLLVGVAAARLASSLGRRHGAGAAARLLLRQPRGGGVAHVDVAPGGLLTHLVLQHLYLALRASRLLPRRGLGLTLRRPEQAAPGFLAISAGRRWGRLPPAIKHGNGLRLRLRGGAALQLICFHTLVPRLPGLPLLEGLPVLGILRILSGRPPGPRLRLLRGRSRGRRRRLARTLGTHVCLLRELLAQESRREGLVRVSIPDGLLWN
mmetsp:Transcript_10860/g.27307  ORF Transcript_10860/g.27307 Transcript_10860/m.27307 type:complete len:384 (+) Transcript_10860:202-1353(+)